MNLRGKKIPFEDNIKYKEATVKEKITFLKMFKRFFEKISFNIPKRL